MHAAGHPEESVSLLRLMVVASSRLLLVLEVVGLMPVISRLDPFPRNACDEDVIMPATNVVIR